jgi:hypothetical protein
MSVRAPGKLVKESAQQWVGEALVGLWKAMDECSVLDKDGRLTLPVAMASTSFLISVISVESASEPENQYGFTAASN